MAAGDGGAFARAPPFRFVVVAPVLVCARSRTYSRSFVGWRFGRFVVSSRSVRRKKVFLEESAAFSRTKMSQNRSVMPLDVPGRTRATMVGSTCIVPLRKERVITVRPLNFGRDWGLEISPTNVEFPVGASPQPASIEFLPFVHTARRYYRLSDRVRTSDWRPGRIDFLVSARGRRLGLTE